MQLRLQVITNNKDVKIRQVLQYWEEEYEMWSDIPLVVCTEDETNICDAIKEWPNKREFYINKHGNLQNC